MNVPVVDVCRQHRTLTEGISRVVSDAVLTGAFVGGPEVEGFEREFASYLGAEEVVAVSTGTAALVLALRALGVSPEDEVIVPANTFIATAEAVVIAGAKPVFCDVEPHSGLVSRRTLEAAVTPATRAVIPVHLWGHVVDLDAILSLAEEKGFFVVEDAAQAHGARHMVDGEGRRAGSVGHAGCFSFYPTKNLGGIGEGGAVAVNDRDLARRIRMLRDHGQMHKHVHESIGDNARLSAILAGVLRLKLRELDGSNERRRLIATRYTQALEGTSLTPVPEPAWSESVYHQFVVRTPERDAWRAALGEWGVGTAIHYPTPIHLQPAFRYLATGTRCEVAEEMADEIFSLPMFADLTTAELDHVTHAIEEVNAEIGRSASTAAGRGR